MIARVSTRLFAFCLFSMACLGTIGCDALEKKEDGGVEKASKVKGEDADDGAPEADDGASKQNDDEAGSAKPASGSPSLDGTVTFSVDGEAKSFEFIPKDQAVMTGLVGTTFRARPDPSSHEEFALSLVKFDPRKAEVPATIAYKPMDLAKSGSPAKIAKSAKAILVYTSPDGEDYKWFPTVHVESWSGGRLEGTLEDVTLKMPSDAGEGKVEISDAKFSVKLR